ncbi:Cadherin-7-like, partial [Scleropages formosus]
AALNPGQALLLWTAVCRGVWHSAAVALNQLVALGSWHGCHEREARQLHSDVDKGEGRVKYVLSGEGASSIFIIDENTGDIHATKRLDREEQAYYTLRAQALDRYTNRPVEPESEFIIKVQDINDNEPKFLDGPYTAGVPEMSPVGRYGGGVSLGYQQHGCHGDSSISAIRADSVHFGFPGVSVNAWNVVGLMMPSVFAGTSVVQVVATDADDPTYGNSARVVYSILEGQPYFSVESKTGIIRTALPSMDREARDQYLLVIQAKDMVGQMGGLSGTTSVTVTLTDVNDNPPRFTRKSYQFTVPESLPVASVVAKIKAADSDVGPNAEMDYRIIDGDGLGMFKVAPDKDTQEGVITLQKVLDFETKASYTLRIEAVNRNIDPRFVNLGTFSDTATVHITVEDVDEPPVFSSPVSKMVVSEAAKLGTIIGTVSAHDPDSSNSAIRYSIDRNTDLERFFNIDATTGVISTAKQLDREVNAVHNITIFAMESPHHVISGFNSVQSQNKLILGGQDNRNQGLLQDEQLEKKRKFGGFWHIEIQQTSCNEMSTLAAREPCMLMSTGDQFKDPLQVGKGIALITVMDINDNAPVFAIDYETFLCEDAKPGQVIQTISAVDPDEPPSGHRFFFALTPEAASNLNFTLRDNKGYNSEEAILKRQRLSLYWLPILIGDSGTPSLSSTNTLSIRVCDCDPDGMAQSCSAEAYMLPAGLSTGALVAILACVLTLLVLVLLIVTMRRRKKEPLILDEERDVRENIVRYDDEGGGEEDTEAFDMVALRNLNVIRDHKARRDVTPEVPIFFSSRPPPYKTVPDNGIFREFIWDRLKDADVDPSAPPYDSLQTYAFEGSGSVAESLSSLESLSTDSDQNYDYLSDWGPRFKKLADLYGHSEGSNMFL